MLAERIKEWPEKWKQEGEQKTRLETARKMIEQTSMDDQMISELSGLDVGEVRKLRDELQR